jgi:hypothetical protein
VLPLEIGEQLPGGLAARGMRAEIIRRYEKGASSLRKRAGEADLQLPR